VEEIITDNGMAYVSVMQWLVDRYGIKHIRISAYNSRANGIVKQQHCTIHDLIVKACEGNISRWPMVTPYVFWADCTMIHKSTGFSPFYMAHSIEPILPFDLALATFLVPDIADPLSTADLIAIHAHQLKKRLDNLAAIRNRILTSHFTSARQFERQHAHTIHDFDFAPGALILVHSTRSDMDKTRPCYYGPMVVLRCTHNGAYRLGKLDGAISRLHYAAFRLIPYHACSRTLIPVAQIIDSDALASLTLNNAPFAGGAGNGSDEPGHLTQRVKI
jgi:hypothetical protein